MISKLPAASQGREELSPRGSLGVCFRKMSVWGSINTQAFLSVTDPESGAEADRESEEPGSNLTSASSHARVAATPGQKRVFSTKPALISGVGRDKVST